MWTSCRYDGIKVMWSVPDHPGEYPDTQTWFTHQSTCPTKLWPWKLVHYKLCSHLETCSLHSYVDFGNPFTTLLYWLWKLVHYTFCIDFGNSFTTLFVLTLENSFTTLAVIYWLWKTRSLYFSIDFWELVHYRSVVAKNPSSLTLTANPDC